MAIKTASRRRHLRYSVTNRRGACIEFEFPRPNGRHFRLDVSDLSASGLSFRLEPDELPDVEAGVTLRSVLLRVGECLIHGDLLMMHITPDADMFRTCGALFYPRADQDLLVLKSVVAGMEAVEA